MPAIRLLEARERAVASTYRLQTEATEEGDSGEAIGTLESLIVAMR